VLINGRAALRVGDQGIHAACCGPNTWAAGKGSESVFINGLPAHRMGDMTVHCGGIGRLIEGSPNVDIGGPLGPMTEAPEPEPDRKDKLDIQVLFEDGAPFGNEEYEILDGSDNVVRKGKTDSNGWIHEKDLPPGQYRVFLRRGWNVR